MRIAVTNPPRSSTRQNCCSSLGVCTTRSGPMMYIVSPTKSKGRPRAITAKPVQTTEGGPPRQINCRDQTTAKTTRETEAQHQHNHVAVHTPRLAITHE